MNSRGAMDIFKNRYFRLSRNFMLWIGLWPYDISKGKTFRRTAVSLLFLSIGVVEVAKLLTMDYNLDLYVECITAILIGLVCFVKYAASWINSEMIRELTERVKQDWRTITDAEELIILRKNAECARQFGLFYISGLCGGLTVCILVTYMPLILNFARSSNKTQHVDILYAGEYFVDDQEYFYPILVHTVFSIVAIHIIAAATDGIFLIFILHACAMFNILGYRFEHLFDDAYNTVETEPTAVAKWNCRFYERMGRCVQHHLRAIQFVKVILNCYRVLYIVELVLAVLILVVLLLRLFDKLIPLKNTHEIVLPVIHVVGFLLVVFMNFYPAQMLIDSSAENFYQVYYGRWYMAPVKAQQLLVFLIQKCMEPSRLAVANFINASLQIYATFVQTSISYFTVLYAMKQ